MFQKDEKVKVRNDLKVGEIYGSLGLNEEMGKYRGKELTIIKVFSDKFLRVKETLAIWDIAMLEKNEEEKDITKKIYNIPLETQDIDLILYILIISAFQYPTKAARLSLLSLKISAIMAKLTKDEK